MKGISNYSRQKGICFLFTLIALVLFCVFTWKKTEKNVRDSYAENLSIEVLYEKDGLRQKIRGIDRDGILYFFLPGYMELADVYLETEDNIYISTENREYKDGENLEEIELEVEYLLEEKETGIRQKISFLKGSELPVISLNTASGTMDYIHAEKGNFESGYMEIIDSQGRCQDIVKIKKIAGRGNTSWDAGKKSYTVKLDETKNLLGMDSGKNWVLNANYYDGSYIRNEIGFALAEAGGILYVPDSEFVELYINGEYMGLYQMMEKVETGPSRSEIGDSYLLEIDYIERAMEEENYIMLPNEQPVVIHSPQRNVDIEKVQQFFDEFTSQIDRNRIPWENIDKESFAKMFVMEEILQDMDFGYTSHYLYLDLEQKILSEGTVWDMDNTMGRGIIKEAEALFVTEYGLQNNNLSRWYAKLYEQKEFRELVAKEYWENFRPAVTEILEKRIEEKSKQIIKTIQMDKKRFPEVRSTFMGEATPDENKEYLISYLEQKINILDECFSEKSIKETFYADLPPLEKQESAFELSNEKIEDEEVGVITFIIRYRFLLFMVIISIIYIILYVQYKKSGK